MKAHTNVPGYAAGWEQLSKFNVNHNTGVDH